MMRRASFFLRAEYGNLLEAYPLLTNSATAGAMYGGSDAAAQGIEWALDIESPHKVEYNWGRTLRMSLFGGCIAGPTLSLWYPLLHKITVAFRVKYKPAGLFSFRRVDILEEGTLKDKAKEVGVKVLFDNLFFQAPFLTCYFLVTGMLEGLSPSAVFDKTQRNFHAAWFYGVLLWGPVQSANFWLVPVPFQALVVNVVNAGWKTSLSVLYHSRDYGGKSSTENFTAAVRVEGEAAVAALMAEAAALRQQVEVQRGVIDCLQRDLEKAKSTDVEFPRK